MTVKAWGEGSLRLEEINHPTWMSDSQLKKPLPEAGVDQALQFFSERDLYQLSLILMQIKQINLPLSWHSYFMFRRKKNFYSKNIRYVGVIGITIDMYDLQGYFMNACILQLT